MASEEVREEQQATGPTTQEGSTGIPGYEYDPEISEIEVCCMWQVTAGLLPDTPLPELTKVWALSKEQANGEDRHTHMQKARNQAIAHYMSISVPSDANWSRIDCMWT